MCRRQGWKIQHGSVGFFWGVMPLEYFGPSSNSGPAVDSDEFAKDLKALDRGQVYAFANLAVDSGPNRYCIRG